MCLSKAKYMGVATEDIVVYKHVVRCDSGDCITSWQSAPVTFRKLLHSKLTDEVDVEIMKQVFAGFHSFKNKEDAKLHAMRYGEVLVKCIIPKGSRYYEGMWNHCDYSHPCYASDQIIYKGVIKDYRKQSKYFLG